MKLSSVAPVWAGMGGRGHRRPRWLGAWTVTLALLLLLLLMAAPAVAAGQEEPLSGWELENRVRRVAEQVRCMVCAGQSVWDSNSGWAFERKEEIRQGLLAGLTEDEILTAFVERWGTGVLMRPPMTGAFWAVWLLPGALLLVAGAALAARLRQRNPVPAGGVLPAEPAGHHAPAGPAVAPGGAQPTAAELAEVDRRLREFWEA